MNSRSQARQVLLLLAVAALTLTGCGLQKVFEDPSGPRLTARCGVVVDGSGSADSVRGFNADALLRYAVPRFLTEYGCRRVSLGPIDGASQSSVCTDNPIDIDPDFDGDRAALRAERRRTAVESTAGVLACIQHDPRSLKGTDVLGGLARAAQQAPAGDADFPVLVISDFIISINGFELDQKDLSTPDLRARAMADQAMGAVPDLSRMVLVTAGYGARAASSLSYPGFDAFWHEVLLQRAQVRELRINPFNDSVTAPSPSTTPAGSR